MDTFKARRALTSGKKSWTIASLEALSTQGFDVSRLPFSIKIFVENLLRNEDGRFVKADDVRAAAAWSPKAGAEREASFMPARVLMQDFTGVPAVVDLAAMRDAMKGLGGDPTRINPLVPVDLVVDHSVQVDEFGEARSFALNAKIEFERNRERYAFLKWGQKAFANFSAVPPETGIVHQVNLEYLAKVVWTGMKDGQAWAYPDTLVGTDSHTTMINGLGVLGWGVGGIEAEAVMLGQPLSMLIPEVVGCRLTGRLAEGATATDVVLTVTELLRKKGVVGKFVEYFGPGVAALGLADRATIANMAPEYGATVGLFPVDSQTLEYLALTGRPQETIRLVEDYCKAQGLFRVDATPDPVFTDTVELDLGKVEPCLAGPRRPQDRVRLADAKASWKKALPTWLEKSKTAAPADAKIPVKADGKGYEIGHGAVTIAAITSCTNTSNPAVLLGAGLLAKKAVEKGLSVPPWVKTSLAPGSKVVMDYLKDSGLQPYLEKLRFFLVGYGCTTCIGNSGPLPEPVAEAVAKNDLVVAAVLSGNRNFEGRVHPQVKAAYLASPPLVVAYALAGRMDVDLATEPLGTGKDGKPVFLKDIWPTGREVAQAVASHVTKEMFEKEYGSVFDGDEAWQSMEVATGDLYAWPESTYVKRPPYFEGLKAEPKPIEDVKGARVLAVLGDSITTDHISPAGNIGKATPAGQYLLAKGVLSKDFNSYGARRGNHEVMMRGTFANIRLRNLLAPGTEGGVTVHLPDGAPMSIYDASMKYQADGIPLIVLAGKEYGSGSSRDWAAKGPALLGVKAVIAESYERIHRSNLVGMGVLPLQYMPGETAASLGLTGRELFSIEGLKNLKPRGEVTVRTDGGKTFSAKVRIDTPVEVDYYRYGGILPYVLVGLSKTSSSTGPLSTGEGKGEGRAKPKVSARK